MKKICILLIAFMCLAMTGCDTYHTEHMSGFMIADVKYSYDCSSLDGDNIYEYKVTNLEDTSEYFYMHTRVRYEKGDIIKMVAYKPSYTPRSVNNSAPINQSSGVTVNIENHNNGN